MLLSIVIKYLFGLNTSVHMNSVTYIFQSGSSSLDLKRDFYITLCSVFPLLNSRFFCFCFCNKLSKVPILPELSVVLLSSCSKQCLSGWRGSLEDRHRDKVSRSLAFDPSPGSSRKVTEVTKTSNSMSPCFVLFSRGNSTCIQTARELNRGKAIS